MNTKDSWGFLTLCPQHSVINLLLKMFSFFPPNSFHLHLGQSHHFSLHCQKDPKVKITNSWCLSQGACHCAQVYVHNSVQTKYFRNYFLKTSIFVHELGINCLSHLLRFATCETCCSKDPRSRNSQKNKKVRISYKCKAFIFAPPQSAYLKKPLCFKRDRPAFSQLWSAQLAVWI